jgi:hypothetical protein
MFNDAGADGLLVRLADVPALAPLVSEAGFKVPAVVTRGVFDALISTPPAAAARGESDTGRAWDLLLLGAQAFQRAALTPDDLFVEFGVHATDAAGRVPLVKVWGVMEGDARGIAQVKFLLPEEY